jgi:hypothetical protein
LLIAGLLGWTCVAPCDAANLKDLRIGEYDYFTRIVFEFDAPVENPILTGGLSDQLDITFKQSQTDLARKIPTGLSNRIKDIQIWMRGKDLIAFIALEFDHFQFKWFQLSSPARVVVDVYASKTPPDSNAQTGVEKTEDTQRIPHALEITRIGEIGAPSTLDHLPHLTSISEISSTASFPTSQRETMTSTEVFTSGDEIKPVSAGKTPERIPKQIGIVNADRALMEQKAGAFELVQFYLVLVLIAITILILIMLLLMIFFRYRWVDKNTHLLKTNEVIRRQDERIAALNKQIQEQLKRYGQA